MPTIGSTAFSLFIKIGIGVGVVLILTALYFGSRSIKRWRQKQKTFKINIVAFNPDGTFFTDKIGKFRTADNIDKMVFMNLKETMPVIDPKYIRANQCVLWRYGPGQYAVIPPAVWLQDPKKFKIDVINMQMKNFAFLEQRAAVSRWAYMKDLLQKWAPYITVLLILILGGVAIWFLAKMALTMFNEVATQRVAECRQILGVSVSPGIVPPAT